MTRSLLVEGQGFAGRDPQLPFDEIEPGDRLGHRVLDLQARVHLHEVEAVGPQRAAAVGDELDGAGADICRRRAPPRPRPRPWRRALRASCRARAPPRSPSDGGAAASSRARRDARHGHAHRRTPASRYGAARAMYFSMQHARIAEGARRLALRGGERRVEILLPVDAPHALAAAARDRLDQHRIARLIGLLRAGNRASWRAP